MDVVFAARRFCACYSFTLFVHASLYVELVKDVRFPAQRGAFAIHCTAVFTHQSFDPEGGSQKATLVVLVVVVSSLKIPKPFFNTQRSATKLCVHFLVDIPYRSIVSDFQLTKRYHFCDQSSFHVNRLKT